MTGGTDDRPEALLEEARRVHGSAYAPYSNFRVAAALEAEDGRVFSGVNVENASSPVGVCAERVALGTAVSSGARSFSRLALVTSGDRPATPCGMCRQALAEFGTELEVWSEATDGSVGRWILSDLLPEVFRRNDEGSRA
ncbi:MAG: cytidine deaminase [Candidatus Palauibacterales bacterium]|nr:cytidine deaminase [Candidatus Palauibacterales bacterium]